MKIVFVMRTPFFLKNFTAGLQELQRRGHEMEIVFSEPQAGRVGEHLAEDGAAFLPGVPMAYLPPPKSVCTDLAKALAAALDVLRYDAPDYDDAPKLRQRANAKGARRLLVRGLLWGARLYKKYAGAARAEQLLRRLLDDTPAPAQLKAWLEQKKPDLLLVSPLTPIGSEQVAWVLAARAAGVRVVYCMYSWDNLTNKGLLRPNPDGAIVWNTIHRDEAVNMHGLMSEVVHCTGAQGFDIWFDSVPSESRRAFCERIGLDPERSFVLYTCSSVFVGGKDELPFMEKWLTALRSHANPLVAGLGVLIRPHPQFTKFWSAADFSRFGNVAVYPRGGAIPFSGNARTEYFDSIHHSVGVVGINTSAMVEAAIIGRPVMTISDQSYAATQSGTLHFRHLERYNFLLCATSVEHSLSLIEYLLQGDADLTKQYLEGNQHFVSEYIRPNGISHPAASFWADAVEAEKAIANSNTVAKRVAISPLIWLALAVFFLAGWLDVILKFIGFGKFSRGSKKGKSTGVKKRKTGPLSWRGKLKRGLLSMRRTKPLMPRDLAQLKGPYRILKLLDEAYANAGAGPRVLVLGDSVHYRVSRDDRDMRTLADMLTEKLSGACGSALCLNYSAHHPGIYAAILGAVQKMLGKPGIAVLPINLRCFSPQWWLHPDHEFRQELDLLEAYLPGAPIGEVIRMDNGVSVEMYDATPVDYPGSPLETIGQFRLIAKAESRSDYQDAWRVRQIAIFHYLHPLVFDHPRLLDACHMIEVAASVGIRPIIYLTPINYQHGIRVVGEAFSQGVQQNVEVIQQALLPLLDSAQGVFFDWSRSFTDDKFFHPGERTEHLNEKGRRELTDLITNAVRGIAC